MNAPSENTKLRTLFLIFGQGSLIKGKETLGHQNVCMNSLELGHYDHRKRLSKTSHNTNTRCYFL